MVSKELVVSQNRHETKVGILEDGQLVEIYLQRANEYSLAGSIHKGRVTRVLPGMQSAFVDLGLDRDCFLYVSDFFEEHADEIDRVGGDDRGRGRRPPQLQNPTLIQQAAPAAAPVEGLEVPKLDAGPPAEGAERTDDAQGRDNRGRRRSRRRRGRGFPESKYASDSASSDEAQSDPADEPRMTDAAQVIPTAVELAPPEDFLVLPGESLSKYRRAASTRENPVPEAEAARLTPEELEQAAEAAAEDAAEALLERVEELEELEALPTLVEEADEVPESESDPDFEIDADPEVELVAVDEPTSITDESVEDEEDEEDEEPVAPAGIAEIETPDQVPGETDEEAASEDQQPEGPEPARTPQSLTATLRAQGGGLPHRISRRGRRRRGRGSESEPVESAPAPAAPMSEPQVNIAALGETIEITRPANVPPGLAPSPGRPERPDRGDGDRGGRGRRDRDRDRDRDRGDRDRNDRDRADRDRADRDRERPVLPSIAELLKEGQEIIVQIAKEPLGQKGARITSHIALPGRYVVYMPTVDHLGVSRKISTDEERQRLKRILQRYREGVQGGYIMRTAGEGRTEEDIAADMQYLATLWLDIREKAEKRRAPALLHHDVEIVERLLRDQLTEGFKAVWVDNEELYEQVLHAVERLQPALLSRVKLYTRPDPIFDAFGITQELEKALRPKVWLKSGGYIVINQTEALVAIDVNTGKYVGKSNRLEDTIVKTNLEAVKEIVRQIRLRDLGGIIVVDFIDMDERKNRQKVMQALEDAMRADKAPYKILQFNDFGLVAITRKRVKQSLERTLCSPCPYCEGAGYVKSVQTVIGEILNEAQKYSKVVDTKDVVCRANPEVAKVLKSTENEYLEELEETLGRPVADHQRSDPASGEVRPGIGVQVAVRGFLSCSVILAAWAASLGGQAAFAQTAIVTSEFVRYRPDGVVVSSDQAPKYRELLSPAVARNAHFTFRVTVVFPKAVGPGDRQPDGSPYSLHIAQNPENSAQIQLFQESYSEVAGEWIPDKLKPVDMPHGAALANGQIAQSYLVDLFVPPEAEANQRFRIEVQFHRGDGWMILPMEVRVRQARVDSEVEAAGAPDRSGRSPQWWKPPAAYACGVKTRTILRNPRTPAARCFSAIFSGGSSILPGSAKRRHARGWDLQLMRAAAITDLPAFCAGKASPSGGPEWWLKARDYLYQGLPVR